MALASAAVVGVLSGTGVPDPPWGTMVVAGVDVGEGTVVADPAAGKLAEVRRMPDRAGSQDGRLRRRRASGTVAVPGGRGRGGAGRGGVGRDLADDGPEVGAGRLAEQSQGALGVLDARQADHDVVALAGHGRVGDAEPVDAPVDDRDRLLQLAGAGLGVRAAAPPRRHP